MHDSCFYQDFGKCAVLRFESQNGVHIYYSYSRNFQFDTYEDNIDRNDKEFDDFLENCEIID